MIKKYSGDEKDALALNEMWQMIDTEYLRDAIEDSIEAKDHITYIEDIGGHFVGAISFVDESEGRQIIALYVKPENRRGGVASRLMDSVDTGGYMWLYSAYEYKGAHKFYKSLGYKKSRAEGDASFLFTIRDTERVSEFKTLVFAVVIGVGAFMFFLIESITNRKAQGKK